MFSHLIGNEEVKSKLRGMLFSGRLPAALLFVGEEGIGKKLFALEVAKALNCRAPREGEPCAECSVCRRISQSTFPFYTDVSENKDRLIWSEHADVAMARPYSSLIRVKAIRELEREANFRPYEGRARVFIIEDADRMNEGAANALLKTLEEPPATSVFILLTTNPTALPPTIRSRSQMISFAPIPASAIEKFLSKEKGLPPADARLLARASRGSIGRALAIDIETYREWTDAMLAVLNALTTTEDHVQLLRSAEELAAARDRDEYEQRLDVLETLIHDAWTLALGRPEDRVLNVDLQNKLKKIAAGLGSKQAARWLSQIEELRAALKVNINRRVATDGLFLSMAAG